MITEHQISSDLLAAPRKAVIHHADEAKSCLLFLDGELYTDRVKGPEVIAAAQVSGSLSPVTCVYLPNLSAADRHEVYTCHERFASFLALEMPRWIEREAGRFNQLFLCGLSLSALQSIFTALQHPGIFAGVLAQSPSAWWQDERLASSLGALPHFSWSLLAQCRYPRVAGGRVASSHAADSKDQPTRIRSSTGETDERCWP